MAVVVIAVLAALAVLGGLVTWLLATPSSPRHAANTYTTLAVADGYARYDTPDVPYGNDSRWSTDGREAVRRVAYLKFDIPAPPVGTRISKVTLSAYVNVRGSSTGPGPVLVRTSDRWSEETLDWRNKPAGGELVATTSSPYRDRGWVRWNVDRALSDGQDDFGGVVSLRMQTAEQKWLGFKSREAGDSVAPRLTITTVAADDARTHGPSAARRMDWGTPVGGDEFGYTGPPDPEKWSVYDSVGQDGRGRRSPSAWNVNGSVATVTGDGSGTTGGMSALFANRRYGRWEARMRTSARDPEYHPVLILWPDAGPGSRCPEIDYAEGISSTTKINFFLHYGCGGRQVSEEKAVDTTQWHNYAVQWNPAGITGYVDGVEWFSDTDPAHQPPGSMHQTVQLDWFPDGTHTRTSWMQVDWVRAYRVSGRGR